MDHGADPTTTASAGANLSAAALFKTSLREAPLRTGVGLGVEYAMFASGLGLALGLFATRVPMRLADRAFGLGLRERFIELIARISPG
jgi:hypothetical protein